MNYLEWLRSWQKDTLQEVNPFAAYAAGAHAMLQALISMGYIDPSVAQQAEDATKHISTVDLSELELYLS